LYKEVEKNGCTHKLCNRVAPMFGWIAAERNSSYGKQYATQMIMSIARFQ